MEALAIKYIEANFPLQSKKIIAELEKENSLGDLIKVLVEEYVQTNFPLQATKILKGLWL